MGDSECGRVSVCVDVCVCVSVDVSVEFEWVRGSMGDYMYECVHVCEYCECVCRAPRYLGVLSIL